MKSLKKAALIALSALMILALAACGKRGNKVVYRTLDEIQDSGTVNIGVFSDKNPFGYVDENGEYQGYDVYFARRLAEDLGGMPLVDCILEQSHTCYEGTRGERYPWGYGCGQCPACKLRAHGYEVYLSRYHQK